MATNVGDLNISLKLDIKPYAESVKAALNIAKQYQSQADALFKLKSPTVDVSKIDAELKKLETTLKGLAAEQQKTTQTQSGFQNELNKTEPIVKKNISSLLEYGQQLTVIGAGIKSISTEGIALVKDFISEANKFQGATIGLERIASFKGIDPQVATNSLQSLDIVKNGLITVGDASLALKNLLATGFSLEQSIDLIKGFGDAAAFGRQSSLSFGYAITSASEGLKNQNSILVDNAGVTKNLSLILKEAGFSEKDLMQVTTNADVRLALHNGILKETAAFTGDATELSKLFAGQQAKLEAQVITLKQSFGVFLQEALLPYLTKVTEGSDTTKIFAGSILTLGGFVTQLAPAVFFLAKGMEALGIGITGAGLAAAGQIAIFSALLVTFSKLKDMLENPVKFVGGVVGMVPSIAPDVVKPEGTWEETEKKVGMGDVQSADRQAGEIEQRRLDIIKKEEEETRKRTEELIKKSKGGSSGPSRTKIVEEERLTLLQQEKKRLNELGEELKLNNDSLAAQLEIMQKIAAVQNRIIELDSVDAVSIKSKVAELEKFKSVIETLPQDSVSAFDSTVEESRRRALASDEFQATEILIGNLGDTLQNELSDAWTAVFGEADTLFENFIQSIISRFAELAINFAISSILSSLFPLAGIVPSFFGGGTNNLSGGGLGLDNLISGYQSRALASNNFNQSFDGGDIVINVSGELTDNLSYKIVERGSSKRNIRINKTNLS